MPTQWDIDTGKNRVKGGHDSDADPDIFFTKMRIRIRMFTLMRIRILTLLLNNWWESANIGLQTLHGSTLSLHASILSVYDPPWVNLEPLETPESWLWCGTGSGSRFLYSDAVPVQILIRASKNQYRKFETNISRKGIARGHSPNFHIHVSVSDLYIPTIDLRILLQEICGPIPGNI